MKDMKDCPHWRKVRETLESRICECKFKGYNCERRTWAIAGDGNWSWTFEHEEGNSWDDLNKAKKKLEQEQEEEEREADSNVSAQKTPKKLYVLGFLLVFAFEFEFM
jgi:hypothetical protein